MAGLFVKKELGAWLADAGRGVAPCRGCLGPLDAGSEAGLCARCWEGLTHLPKLRCQRCALVHDEDRDCPEPVAWEHGDAFWDYHGGRPAFGALLIPGIKAGEMGWRKALLRRVQAQRLPAFAMDADLITCAPTALFRGWMRGFDVAEDVARMIAARIGRPFFLSLSKDWRRPRQMGQTESARRLLPRKAIGLRGRAPIHGKVVLLVDDVWTTGTTLLRCSQTLLEGGAAEVRVLTLFRAT